MSSLFCPWCDRGLLWPTANARQYQCTNPACNRIHVDGLEFGEYNPPTGTPAWWGPPEPPARPSWPDRTLERWKGTTDPDALAWCELARAELKEWERAYARWKVNPANHWPACNGEEVLGFGLSTSNAPDGSGVARLDDPDLRRLLEMADRRLRSGARTRWLERYAGLLVAESRRRRGVA